MCWFRKKKSKSVITGNKFEVGESVRFRYRDEMSPGTIYDMRLDSDNNIVYDVQIGGECPVVINNIKEDKIYKR